MSRFNTLAESLLAASPLPAIWLRRTAGRLRVLAYHGVADPERFRHQVSILRKWLRPVSCDEVVAALSGDSLPSRAVLVTFDDGERSVLDRGLPVLERYQVPAALFPVAGVLDGDQPFWWVEVEELVRRGASWPEAAAPESPAAALRRLKSLPDEQRRSLIARLRESAGAPAVRTPQLTFDEVRELASRGVEIGNHTLSHPCLDRCATPRVAEEIEAAHHALADVLRRPPRLFAYPNGNLALAAEPVLERLGYRGAFLFDHRTVSWPPVAPLRLSRLRADAAASPARFRLIVSGFHSWLHRVRGRT